MEVGGNRGNGVAVGGRGGGRCGLRIIERTRRGKDSDGTIAEVSERSGAGRPGAATETCEVTLRKRGNLLRRIQKGQFAKRSSRCLAHPRGNRHGGSEGPGF